MITRFKETQKLLRARPVIRNGGRNTAWLPVPPVALPRPTERLTSHPKKPRSVWVRLESDGLAEKALLALLVAAAIAAIGFGFSSLLDMVQGWGAFNSWVAQIIQ